MKVEQSELPINRGDYPTIPEDTTLVRPGEWALGKRVFMADGVTTGIVMVAHNHATGDGLLGHFSHVSPEFAHDALVPDTDIHTDSFAEALAMIKRLGPAEDTDIWLGGAADNTATSAGIDLTIEGERQFAQLALQQAMLDGGIPTGHMRSSWSGKQEELIVQLNSLSGVLLVNHVETSS